MRKLLNPCGFHCIKMNDIGVSVGEQIILHDVNLHIHCGELAAIIGKNGAGKSTLIRAILDDIPHTGTIEYKDRQNGNFENLKIGYVPQSLNLERKTPVSVYDMLATFQTKAPVFIMKRKKTRDKILETLRIFKAEDLIDKQVCNLSGGELQRVLLSMAVMDEPNLLLLDEPVSGIDQNGMDLFYETVDALKSHYDLAVILISHDLDYVARYADQVILLDKTVVKQGKVREVYESKEFLDVFGTFDLDSLPSKREKRDGKPANDGLNKALLKKKANMEPEFNIKNRGRLL